MNASAETQAAPTFKAVAEKLATAMADTPINITARSVPTITRATRFMSVISERLTDAEVHSPAALLGLSSSPGTSSSKRPCQRTAARSKRSRLWAAITTSSASASARLRRPSSRAAISASNNRPYWIARWKRPCGVPYDVMGSAAGATVPTNLTPGAARARGSSTTRTTERQQESW